MKKIASLILALSLCRCLTTVAFAADTASANIDEAKKYEMVHGLENKNTFSDVSESDYYADAIKWAVEQGITNGIGNNQFGVNSNVTRAQAVTFLWRAMGSPTTNGTGAKFDDVEKSSWYEKAVIWAVQNKITDGIGNNKFSPDGAVTRGQLITFLWRTEGKPNATGQGAWYEDAEHWANAEGLLSGTAEEYKTNKACPREDVVYYIWKEITGVRTTKKLSEAKIDGRNTEIIWDEVNLDMQYGFANHYNNTKNHTIEVGDYYDTYVKATGYKRIDGVRYVGYYEMPARFIVSKINCNEVYVDCYCLDTMDIVYKGDDSEDEHILYMADPKQYLEYGYNTYILDNQLRTGDIPVNTVFLDIAASYPDVTGKLGPFGSTIGEFRSYDRSDLYKGIDKYVNRMDLPLHLYDRITEWEQDIIVS